MNQSINLNLHAMHRFSELLVNPEAKKISLRDWLESYNTAKDGQLKYILKKCIPLVDSFDFSTIVEDVEIGCVYEKCDLLLQYLDHNGAAKESILEWLAEQINTTDLTLNKNPDQCICSLLKLAIELVGKGAEWTPYLSIKLLKVINSVKDQRCALNAYLDLITASVETNIDDYDYIEQLYTGLIFKLNPAKYLNLTSTIDDKPEIMFNGISDCLLLRKFTLPHLMIVTRVDLSTFLVDEIDTQLMEMEEQIGNAIHWSHHPFIDLYLEDDTMLLKCVNCLIEVQGFIIRNELEAHQIFEKFINSINHDTGVFIEWLTSDSEVADLTLRLLLAYLKLPNIKTKCSKMVKIFFNQLLTKIADLYRDDLFPYNPSALLKHQPKFYKTEDSDDE